MERLEIGALLRRLVFSPGKRSYGWFSEPGKLR